MSDEPEAQMSSLRLDVTMPCQARYLPMLRQLAVRTVDYLGYHEAVRDEVAQTIDLALAGMFGAEGVYRDVEVQLATTETDMLVRIRYLGASGHGDSSARIAHYLSESDSGEPLIARLERVMKSVVVGREPGHDAVDYCELTKALPADPEA